MAVADCKGGAHFVRRRAGDLGGPPEPDEMAHTDTARQAQCWMVPPCFQVWIAKLVAHGVVLPQGHSSRLRGLSALMGMQPGRERSSPLYAVRPFRISINADLQKVHVKGVDKITTSGYYCIMQIWR